MNLSQDVLDAAYNLDRAVASLFGAPPQETISSEAGRLADHNDLARWLATILNTIQPGHTAKAEAHATALDQADTGFEG